MFRLEEKIIKTHDSDWTTHMLQSDIRLTGEQCSEHIDHRIETRSHLEPGGLVINRRHWIPLDSEHRTIHPNRFNG